MSECVVRMEMPTKENPCKIAVSMQLDGWTFWMCPILNQRCLQPEGEDCPGNCPIICQLPEGHGRLGDLDELGRKINGARIRAMQDGQDTNPYWECGDIIASEKTIVPADTAERSEVV